MFIGRGSARKLTRIIQLKMLTQLFKLSRRACSTASGKVIVSRRNDKAILQFNRPEKLNAMNLQIQVDFATFLRDFENDSSVSAVIIKGNEAGFSAGGDVVQFSKLIKSDDKSRECFFQKAITYYRGLLRLSEYKKPVIVLADKICMGGGAATAFLASHPVVTERTVFAMPEVFIGFFPNVGADYFLAQLPNNYGMWIALTGSKFIGSDIVHLGLTKNYVHSADLDKLEDAIINLEKTNFESVSDTIAQFQQKCDDWHIQPNQVNEIFGGSSVEDIVERLKSDGTDFSAKILKTFSIVSPTALKFTFNLLRMSQVKRFSKNEALSADLSLFKNFYGHPSHVNDFLEGTRSVLVDKKHKPNWIPQNLHEVDDAKLISFFTTNTTDIRASSP